MPYIKIDKGYKVYYNEKGKGRNLVFIHGFLGSSWLFEAQLDYFSSNFHTINTELSQSIILVMERAINQSRNLTS